MEDPDQIYFKGKKIYQSKFKGGSLKTSENMYHSNLVGHSLGILKKKTAI